MTDDMPAMRDWLLSCNVAPPVVQMALTLGACSEAVAGILASTPVRHVGTRNAFGDKQLSVDVLADLAIFEILKNSKIVEFAASEEKPVLSSLSEDGAHFSVCFDPLDGSSIVDCNWAVGSIFGVWPSGPVVGKTGADQLMSAMTVYGPRLTMMIGVKEQGLCFEATFVEKKWRISTPKLSISRENFACIFSPANLKATRQLVGYAALVEDWMARKWTLRYTGGLVPDVGGILSKGAGIFVSPVCETAPAKLRLVFECAPVALLVELAGGSTGNVLKLRIEEMEHRSGLVCGSRNEVENVLKFIYFFAIVLKFFYQLYDIL